MAYLQKKNYMFQHVVELHVVEMTCKNLHDSETPVMLRIRIWIGGGGGGEPEIKMKKQNEWLLTIKLIQTKVKKKKKFSQYNDKVKMLK